MSVSAVGEEDAHPEFAHKRPTLAGHEAWSATITAHHRRLVADRGPVSRAVWGAAVALIAIGLGMVAAAQC